MQNFSGATLQFAFKVKSYIERPLFPPWRISERIPKKDQLTGKKYAEEKKAISL